MASKKRGAPARLTDLACSLTCGAASADLGLSAGSPIGLLYDFPEVFFVPLGAFAFRAPLGLLGLPGNLLGCLYAPSHQEYIESMNSK